MIRSIWVWTNLFIATFSLSAIAVVASFLHLPTRIYDWCARSWARWTLRVAGVHVRMEGVERVAEPAARIFVSNHQSWFDVFALAGSLPEPNRFVAKKELARIPVFGRAWRSAGHISIDRGDTGSAIRTLDEAGRLMRRDKSSVIIFAEGTRSPTGELRPFKKGAFMLALQTGVDIVPVGIEGSRAVLPKGSWRVTPGEIVVRIGNVVHTADYSFDKRSDLMKRVRQEVAQLMQPIP
ncbi:MAG: lysophospholipid acyltransferase family protein [Gemmatimonadota bacterium]